MNPRYIVMNSILWAAAIIASALLRAPTALTLLLLPSLATTSYLMTVRPDPRRCRT